MLFAGEEIDHVFGARLGAPGCSLSLSVTDRSWMILWGSCASFISVGSYHSLLCESVAVVSLVFPCD